MPNIVETVFFCIFILTVLIGMGWLCPDIPCYSKLGRETAKNFEFIIHSEMLLLQVI